MKLRLLGVLLLAAGLALSSGCGDNEREELPPPATNTAAPTNTAVPPTNTAVPPTSTPVPPTDTPPPVAGTPTFTPTPEDTPVGGGLGQRVFTIADTMFGSPDLRTALFSTGLGGMNVASAFSAGPLTFMGGAPAADGVASFTLAEDAEFAVNTLGGVVCFRVFAAESSGSIDCDGGSAVDVDLSQDAGEDAPEAVLTTGLGEDGGPGAAFLLVMQQSVQLAVGQTFDACATATFDPAQLVVDTTGQATATKGPVTVTVSGENFSCDGFAETDGAGMLANPSVAFNALAPGGNAANVARLADN